MGFIRLIVLAWLVLCQTAVAAPVDSAQLNQALGMELFPPEGTLWEESSDAVASRLNLKPESTTPLISRHRRDGVDIFGRHATSLILNSELDRPSEFLLPFTNKGDSVQKEPDPGDLPDRRMYREAKKRHEEKLEELADRIKADEAAISEGLSTLLGRPKNTYYGATQELRCRVDTWEWNGHTFLLAADEDEGAWLRLVPPETAAARGRTTRITDKELRERLQQCVETRPNGDVIIRGIPMVDQGNKGYCVPSTWARYFQYLGIPADEYTFAEAAGTAAGGGTSTRQMVSAAEQLASSNGRRIEKARREASVRTVSSTIDKGLPLMWTMYSVPPFDRLGAGADRMGSMSPEEWGASLDERRKAARDIKKDRDRGHVCMIIGYNPITKEICTSDSWGHGHEEKWYPEEEVEAVDAGELFFISW